MRSTPLRHIFLALSLSMACTSPPSRERGDWPGVRLTDLTWQQAERILSLDSLVILPLGAASKEHGPHLLLSNDAILASYFEQRLLESAAVVLAPGLPYHYYPAFLEYPGSTTLSMECSRDVVVDVCRSLARYGPRRFYVLNTGVSTLRALEPAAKVLARSGILLHYTNVLELAKEVEEQLREQEGGTHADELETSMMLYIAPQTVDMSLAAKDYHPAPGPLTRDPQGRGSYSATGIYGDATLATREKGERIVEAMLAGMLSELRQTRQAPLPVATHALDGEPALASFAGTYGDRTTTLVVTDTPTGLELRLGNEPARPLIRESSHGFCADGLWRLTFLPDAEQAAAGIHLRRGHEDLFLQRVEASEH